MYELPDDKVTILQSTVVRLQDENKRLAALLHIAREERNKAQCDVQTMLGERGALCQIPMEDMNHEIDPYR